MSVILNGIDMPLRNEHSELILYGDGNVTTPIGGDEVIIGHAAGIRHGSWLFDSSSEAASTFRICSVCGAVFHICSGDSDYRFCPTCGSDLKGAYQ